MKGFGSILILVSMIFSYIWSYHVVVAAAPAYMWTWWTAFVLVLVGMVFTAAGVINGED